MKTTFFKTVIGLLLLTVSNASAQAWEPVGSVGFTEDSAPYTSLTLDTDGTPYVAFQDKANSNKATVMKFENGDWQVVGTAGISSGIAQFISLAISDEGIPYVAFQDGRLLE